MACTISLCHEQEIQKKLLQRAGYEPKIVCITASCLNHYTTCMLASYRIVTVYVYSKLLYLTRKAGDEEQEQQHPPPPGPP